MGGEKQTDRYLALGQKDAKFGGFSTGFRLFFHIFPFTNRVFEVLFLTHSHWDS